MGWGPSRVRDVCVPTSLLCPLIYPSPGLSLLPPEGVRRER